MTTTRTIREGAVVYFDGIANTEAYCSRQHADEMLAKANAQREADEQEDFGPYLVPLTVEDLAGLDTADLPTCDLDTCDNVLAFDVEADAVAVVEAPSIPALRRLNLTEQIAQFLGVTVEVGALVRDYVDEEIGLDWSEATQREIDEACREAYEALTREGVAK